MICKICQKHSENKLQKTFWIYIVVFRTWFLRFWKNKKAIDFFKKL